MIQKKSRKGIHPWWILFSTLGIVGILFCIVFIPWNISNLSSHPNPAQGYAQAMQRIAILRTKESPDMNPVCRLQLMTHGEKVHHAVILVHGYTACPQQFHELGRRLYALGDNVLIAPLPHHGLADRMTETQAKLRAEELAKYADETVDIAQGLGECVIMMGISAGGVVTAWAAQHRKDIALAVMIAPAFGFKCIPTPFTIAAMNTYMILTNSFRWKNPVKQADVPTACSYPRYSTRALVQILRLGFATREDARHKKPAAQKMLVVLNAHDDTVNNELTMDVVNIWQAHGVLVNIYTFKPDLKLGHDLIDPSQLDQRIDIVYPSLINLVEHVYTERSTVQRVSRKMLTISR